LKYRYVIVVFFSAYFLTGNSLLAENGKKPLRLDAIVVTAEKEDETYETGDVDTGRTPANYTIIKREQFEGKMEDLAEVIKKEAGIQVRRSGGLGSFSTVSLRGSTSDQVMVYMDGVLMNDASGGGVNLGNISLSDVESIEIYKGTSPINFGKASIGGVVNIKTRRSEKGFNASLGAGHGSFNTNEASGFINYKPGKWDLLVSADYFGSDNDYEIENDNGTPLNPDDDKKETRQNAQFDQYNVLGKFGYDVNEKYRIELVNQWFYKDQGLPDWSNTSEATFDTGRNISTIKFTADNLGPLHLNTATKLSYLSKNEEYKDTGADIGLGDQHSKYTTTKFGGEFYAEWLTDMNTLILVMDVYHETYDPEDLLSDINPNTSSRDMMGIGVQDSFMLFDDILAVTPGFRYSYYKDKLDSRIYPAGSSRDSISQDEGYFNPQIGIKLRPEEWLAFKTNLARYNRVPSFFELFGDRGFFVGNPDLEPESGVNFDVSLEVNRKLETMLVQRISATAVYFQNNVDDLITRIYDARGIGKSVNISSASIKGVELMGTVDLLTYFTLIGNATFQDPENRSSIQGFNGKKLPGQFERKYLLKAEARYRNWKLFVEYVANMDLYYDTANLLKAEDQNSINMGISWLYKQLLVTLEGKNITDENYEDYNSYPMPGASYFIKAKYNF